MIVSHRINARKVVLTFYYMRFFVVSVMHKDSILNDLLSLDSLFDTRTTRESQKKELIDNINTHYDTNTAHDRWIDYILKQYFSKIPKEQIDYAYVRQLSIVCDEYINKARGLLSSFTLSFSFDEMDPMDCCIFALALAEFTIIGTPKEVIINEMIELAKRFGDEWSPKLIHAWVHTLLSTVVL